jgi:hypothetical protein
MKNKLYSTLAMLSLFLMLGVASVQAQSRGKLEVSIPFQFQIGSQTFAAGDYSVKRLTQNSILVRSADGQKSVIALMPRAIQNEAGRKAAQEKLVFHQYGNQYFLAQVWMNRDGDGHELNISKAERQAASEGNMANGSATLRKIEVAARTR